MSSTGSAFYISAGSGQTVQIVYTLETAYTEGTTKLADLDDDIPQQTDGTEIMTRSITPTSATNGLLINVVLNIGSNSGTSVIGCLFQDSTANALASWMCLNDAAGYGHQIVMQYYMVAGTTSETTFKVRVGNHNASDEWNVNGSSSGRLFGGTAISSITITEIVI